MSTTAGHLHPLISRLRRVMSEDEFLTQSAVAEQLGVSTRTLSYWLNTDTTPQKRYRRPLAEWLAERERSREDALS